MPNGNAITLRNTPHYKQVTAAAMLDSGSTLRAIAKQLKMGMSTIITIRRTIPANLPEVEAIKKRLPGRFYANASEFLNNITPAKLEASSAYQLVGMASLSVQAARDMEGLNRPTFNIIDIAMNVERLTAQARERLSAIETRLTSTQTVNDAA